MGRQLQANLRLGFRQLRADLHVDERIIPKWILQIKGGGALFENRVLRSVLESNRDEVTGSWRKLFKIVPFAKYN
jgi:hypothetical protein